MKDAGWKHFIQENDLNGGEKVDMFFTGKIRMENKL
jgi:hypothetical protein